MPTSSIDQTPAGLIPAESAGGVSRRSVMRGSALAVGAAWAAPAVLSAVGTPAFASSDPNAVDNSIANYFFADHSTALGELASIDPPAGGGLVGTRYSVQTGYRADPWITPVSGATMTFTITFNQLVTFNAFSTSNWVKTTPADNGPSTVFSFTTNVDTALYGPQLTFFFDASEYGEITSVNHMSMTNSGHATWSDSDALATATLVAVP